MHRPSLKPWIPAIAMMLVSLISYVLTSFRQRMREEGFSAAELDLLFVENPRRFFAGEP